MAAGEHATYRSDVLRGDAFLNYGWQDLMFVGLQPHLTMSIHPLKNPRVPAVMLARFAIDCGAHILCIIYKYIYAGIQTH